jgi:hypothetical protein
MHMVLLKYWLAQSTLFPQDFGSRHQKKKLIESQFCCITYLLYVTLRKSKTILITEVPILGGIPIGILLCLLVVLPGTLGPELLGELWVLLLDE